MTEAGGDHIAANIGGNVSGQFAVGKNIAQTHHRGEGGQLSGEERAELEQLFAAVRSRIAAEVPEAQRSSAAERVDELEEALTAGEPDLGTVEYVKRWFLKRLPHLAGLVTAILVNPIVGKLVQSAGDAAVSELARVAEE